MMLLIFACMSIGNVCWSCTDINPVSGILDATRNRKNKNNELNNVDANAPLSRPFCLVFTSVGVKQKKKRIYFETQCIQVYRKLGLTSRCVLVLLGIYSGLIQNTGSIFLPGQSLRAIPVVP